MTPPAASLHDERVSDAHPSHGPKGGVGLVAIAALGVVFGDIGTSPLYTLQLATESTQNPADLLGVLSLIFWGLTLVVSIKYITFVMRADNRGEGGILALLALIPESPRRKITWITIMIVIGAALLFGDGIITPAISVLSAIEGLKLAAPDAFPLPLIIAITIVILIGLFAIQHRGTGTIGKLFGPVMMVWFVTIAVLGAAQIIQHPGVLRALSPHYGVEYFADHGWRGLAILGVVVLCLTGGEALYADMGHFGAKPIRLAWFIVAMPALVLCYFGQGALLLHDPTAAANPFFSLVPVGAATYALVVLSTVATIIASQALISGVFSLTHQAVQLGLFPRVTIAHTSAESEGQIYVPQINWGLAIACCVLVLVFEESSKLAAAYGIAVSGTMAITSVAFYLVTRRTWKWPAGVAVPLLVLFLGFDIPLFGANLTKFFEGGYVPILVGFLFFVVMISWRTGRSALTDYAQEHAMPIEEFLKTVNDRVVMRVPGTSVFLTSRDVPLILDHYIRRIRVLHERVVLLTVTFDHVPYVPVTERIEVTDLTKGFARVRLRYGYIDKVDVPQALVEAGKQCTSPFVVDDPTYYIGRETFLATAKGRLGPVRESIFAFLSRNAASAATYLGIPPENVMEIGAQIDL